MKDELLNLMEAKGLNQTQIARAIGKSIAVVNQYLQGKYTGNVTAIDELVGNLIRRYREKDKEKAVEVNFVLTPTARKAIELISLAHQDGEINVLYGEAGIGKTLVLRHYASENPDCILIEADPSYTAKVLLQELSNRLNISAGNNLHELLENCIAKLRQSGRLLIIDEAELLPYRALEVLRRIHDKTGVGIVLAGMPRLIINLKGRKGEYVQLYSRVGFALNLGNALPNHDIEMITHSILQDADEKVLNALFTASKGNARRLFKLLRGVVRTSRINQCAVNVATVNQFAKMLIN